MEVVDEMLGVVRSQSRGLVREGTVCITDTGVRESIYIIVIIILNYIEIICFHKYFN